MKKRKKKRVYAFEREQGEADGVVGERKEGN